MNELKFNLETLKARLDSVQRDVQDHEKENKLLLKELEENAKSFEKREKSDQDKR